MEIFKNICVGIVLGFVGLMLGAFLRYLVDKLIQLCKANKKKIFCVKYLISPKITYDTKNNERRFYFIYENDHTRTKYTKAKSVDDAIKKFYNSGVKYY